MMKNKKNQALTIGILLSLMVHALISALLLVSKAPEPPKNSPIEIVIQESSGEEKQIVFLPEEDQKPVDKQVEKLEKEVKRLSKLTQRVKEEMVARNTGETRNRPPSSPTPRTLPDRYRPQTEPTKPGPGRRVKPQRRQRQQQQQVYIGDSSIAQLIPGVRKGGYTSLNTDQFMYYTFYSRINEQVVNRWVLNVRQFLATDLAFQQFSQISSKEHVTQVTVLLDERGHYVDTLLEYTSGVPGLDQAVVQAFRTAAPFNNPPEEILKEDGYVHLKYRFYLLFDPRRLAQGSRSR